MASELGAQPPTSTSSDQISHDSILVNGNTSHDDIKDETMQNQDLFGDSQHTAVSAPTINLKEQPAPAETDTEPAAMKPIEHTTEGIAPLSDFISKEAPNLSHPTPPPEENLMTSVADVDTKMEDQPPVESTVAPPTEPADLVVQPAVARESLGMGQDYVVTPVEKPASPIIEPESSSSLVRPREDDEDEEPAAKRSKVDEAPAEPVVDEAPAPIEPPIALPSADPTPREETVQTTVDAPLAPAVQSPPQIPEQPSAQTQEELPAQLSEQFPAQLPEPSSAQIAEQPPAQPTAEAPAQTAEQTSEHAPAAQTTEQQPMQPPVSAHEDVKLSVEIPAPATTTAAPTQRQFSTAPMTKPQKDYLLEKMKNVKKTKAALSFLAPVDPVVLNIPNYPDIIKTPMDLGTMDQRLKQGQYENVQSFVNDFNQIIANTVRFNGEQHPVTVAGRNLEAYFNKIMELVPSADQAAAPKKPVKRASPKPAPPSRRESRAAAASSPTETFALQADGVPQIRRDSTMNRPARAIKPPQSRELTYAKPKRKEHQLELKFCEHVLDELSGPAYGNLNHVFQVPVDPVALNIPQYRQIVKHPMDLSTIRQKLKTGQYGKANEFAKDFKLMVDNCLTFNPPGNPVRDIGVQYRREFDRMWLEKDKWEKKNAPASNRASSASADESEPESEEEEDASEDQNATLEALKKQLSDIHKQIGALGKTGTKPKKQKAPKPSKKAAPVPPPKSSKPKQKAVAPSKRVKPVTYEEKQEISQAVEKMDVVQIEKLTSIITQNCEKYRNMGDDLELEIDDLPNDVQLLLLKHVRSIFGTPARTKQAAQRAISPDDLAAVDDDDFEPERRGSKGGPGAAKKKHKPMKRGEQANAIASLRNQIAGLTSQGVSGPNSQSPTNSSYANQQESSGDEESEESEEE